MTTNKTFQYVAAGVAAVAIAFGAYAAGNGGSGEASTDAANARAAAPGTTQQNGQPPTDGQPPTGGQMPPGFGTEVTGTAAAKVEAAALAQYDGTIERILQLPDGAYVAHVLTANGEYHVAVSEAFEVLGLLRGDPGRGGAGAPATPGGSQGQTADATQA